MRFAVAVLLISSTVVLRRKVSFSTTETTYRNHYAEKVDLCTECRACIERCPAQLEIPELLQKAKITLGQN